MTTTATCATCDDSGEVERLATPDEVDNGYELGVAFDPCPACSPAPVHPARWSASVLERVGEVIHRELGHRGDVHVLDPFAGVGLPALAEVVRARSLVGVELQPEWAAATIPGTPLAPIIGDATALPESWQGTFDAVVTSPCYGNRMGDHHHARDACGTCAGQGCEQGCGACTSASLGPDSHKVCSTCKGHGLSWRNTYAHALRRGGGELVAGSAAGMQWGRDYRELHRRAIVEMRRVLVEDGLIVVNMSNHVRNGDEQLVVEWWVNELIVQGCRLVEVTRVATPRQRNGANGEARVDGEVVIVMRTPSRRGLL